MYRYRIKHLAASAPWEFDAPEVYTALRTVMVNPETPRSWNPATLQVKAFDAWLPASMLHTSRGGYLKY